MSTETQRRAVVVDFDDTIIGRGSLTRFIGMVMGRIHHQHLPELIIEDIANLNLDHGRVDAPVSGIGERLSFWFHSRRRLYPRVREEFEGLVAEGIDILGATGRSNKAPWVDMSERQVAPVKDLFKAISYTPRGIKTAVSKAHVVYLLLESGQYDEVEVDEDDPRTVEFLSKLFSKDPRVTINYIKYTTTSKLDPTQRDIRPNVLVSPGLYEREEEAVELALARAREQIRILKKYPFALRHGIISIADELTDALPVNSLIRSTFRNSFMNQLFKELGHYSAEDLRVALILSEKIKFSELAELFGIDPEVAFRFTSHVRIAGSSVGRMLTDPDVPIPEVANVLSIFLLEKT